MIDLGLLRESPDYVIKKIKIKDPSFPTERLIELDQRARLVRQEVETLRAEKNDLARQAQHGVTESIRMSSKSVGETLKAKEEKLRLVESEYNNLYMHCPNLPFDAVPEGGKEANKVVKISGEKKVFSFPIKNHVELGIAKKWFDFEAATRTSGSQFALYKNAAVDLVYALALFMYKHNKKNGYQPILPPYLLNRKALEGASNFPRFEDNVYAIPADGLYLTPTAEVNLANLYRDMILDIGDLPLRLTSWTSCFRREAGGYGANERGLIRIHQFEKVELFTLCEPDRSGDEQDRMIACAEELLQKLGLHYRISLLAGQDCSFPSAKTYDIEIWLPGQNEYKEVSSISNCTDFQARRCAIRYRKSRGEKTQLIHTLNGSSLAIPRLMAALMETYQQHDGSIVLPGALQAIVDDVL